MADPIRGEVNPAAVAAELHVFFDHLFTVDFEFYLIAGKLHRYFLLMIVVVCLVWTFFVCHLGFPPFVESVGKWYRCFRV